jgi:hypothetical protein
VLPLLLNPSSSSVQLARWCWASAMILACKRATCINSSSSSRFKVQTRKNKLIVALTLKSWAFTLSISVRNVWSYAKTELNSRIPQNQFVSLSSSSTRKLRLLTLISKPNKKKRQKRSSTFLLNLSSSMEMPTWCWLIPS